MKIRHTVIFTFYTETSDKQIDQVIARLNEMGEYLQSALGVTDWIVTKHIPETYKPGRGQLLQDGVFPNVESLQAHANSDFHQRVVALTSKVCDWMTIDTPAAD